MKKIIINNTDLLVSQICYGVANIGIKASKSEDYAMLDAFIQAGGNFIDTARIYSDWVLDEKGRSERMLGEWIRERNYKKDLIIATKGGHPSLKTMNIGRLSKADIKYDITLSLKALRTDKLDLYYLHRDDETIPVGEMIEYLQEFKSQGYIRYYACSNWNTHRITAAQEYARKKGYVGFVANEMYWNMATANMQEEGDKSLVKMDEGMHDMHKACALCAMPYSSQVGGYFSKILNEPEKAYKMIYHTVENENLANKLAKKFSGAKTPMQYVLGYFFNRPFQVIPVFSASNTKQVNDTIYAANNSLNPEILGL